MTTDFNSYFPLGAREKTALSVPPHVVTGQLTQHISLALLVYFQQPS